MRVFLQLGQIPPQHTFLDLRCTRRQHFDHPEMDTSEQAIRPLDQREVMIDYPRYYHATVPIAPQGDHTTPHEAGWYALDRSESPSHAHGTDDRLQPDLERHPTGNVLASAGTVEAVKRSQFSPPHH